MLARELVHVVGPGCHLEKLLAARRRQRRNILFAGKRLRTQPCAVLRQNFGGAVVDEMSVLDALRAGSHRALH
ncbi:hypothetical protein NECAME_18770 [Necator americanus]|uniref:Uncharacterized protein n=1 Tax=Necator americanus TaxID=51031 RepID=W2SSV1_NECAM|nr:hypothetical protein NECAME_18770 [Necator americanus]ETN72603.1 hypothetical protein NECAME_18770 [Necator americanus]